MPWAVQIDSFGGPEKLIMREVEMPVPAEGELLVRVTAAGLNFIDTYHRTGYYPVPELPATLGVEGAGRIEAVGSGVDGWTVGDRVAFAGPRRGAYAQYHVIPEASAVALPDAVDDVQAAAMMLKGMTARYLLRETYPVGPEDTILVHAAAGGVGSILVQWAHHLGATIIGTVGSPEKADLARSYGCSHPVLYRQEDVAQRVREITDGRGVAVVYDSVGRDTFEQSLSCLRRRGMIVTFGQSSGAIEAFDPVLLSRHGSLFLTRPTLFDYIVTRDEIDANAAELFDLVTRGVLDIPARQVFPLSDAAAAHRALEARETRGSTVLVVE